MTEDEKVRAREIYFKYCCNSFFLHREDDAEEYESYNASREEESRWRQEFIEIWKNRLSANDLQPLHRLVFAHAGEVLPEVVAMADKADDGYVKLEYANTIWELASARSVTPALREQAVEKAARLWRELIEKPFEISGNNREIIAPGLQSFGVATAEEYVRKYARNMLRHIR